MGPIAIITGLVLIADGLVTFGISFARTALIPAGFGLVLVVLGCLARQEKLRMHVMHVAVLVGLIGGVMAAFLTGSDVQHYFNEGAFARPTATIAKAVMAVTCLLFVSLCVKSFVDARRRRLAGEVSAPSQS
jgi:uncharacterized membrane protein HdeD (DUF308 family)